MPAIPVQCMVCGKSVKDSMFPQHMQSVHGGMSQSEAIIAEKNIPNPQIPIVLDKDAPPSDDFMEVAAMLDKPKETSSEELKKKLVNPFTPKVERERKPKEIKLEYKYSGECQECLVPVETLVVKVKGQTVTVAFCTKHGQLKEREVADLEKDCEPLFTFDPPISEKEADSMMENLVKPMREEIRREGKRKRVKQRSKSIVQSKVAL